MALNEYEKNYIDSVKKQLTPEQWEQFLGLSKLNQKAKILERIDQDIAGIDEALLRLELDRLERETVLNSEKVKLNDLKTKIQDL